MAEYPDVFQTRFRGTLHFRHWFVIVQCCKFILVILGFLMRRKKNDVLHPAKKLLNMARNNRAFSTIITSKLGEKPTCVHLLLQLYLQNLFSGTCICTSILKLHQLNLHCMKSATGVSELSSICSTGKIVYIQIIRTDLWSFQAHWSDPKE